MKCPWQTCETCEALLSSHDNSAKNPFLCIENCIKHFIRFTSYNCTGKRKKNRKWRHCTWLASQVNMFCICLSACVRVRVRAHSTRCSEYLINFQFSVIHSHGCHCRRVPGTHYTYSPNEINTIDNNYIVLFKLISIAVMVSRITFFRCRGTIACVVNDFKVLSA